MRKKKKLWFGGFHHEWKVLLLIGIGVAGTDANPLMLMMGLILSLATLNKDPIGMRQIILSKHPKRLKFADVWVSFVDKLVITLKCIV